MKKSTLIYLLMCVSVAVFAQKKPNINKAKSAFDSGNLAEAKTIIDQAIVYEKTKDKAKTWYYRAQIYMSLDTTNNDDKMMKEALASFDKAIDLDPKQTTTTSVSLTGIENVDSKKNEYFAYYFNKAAKEYNEENMSKASEDFEKAFMISGDTSSLTNAAYSAAAAEDKTRAKRLFKKAIEKGYADKNIYLSLYNYAVKEQDNEKALSILQGARKNFPDDLTFIKQEINLFIQLKRTDEAKEGLEEATEKEPNNPDLFFSLGVLYDEIGEQQQAIENYKKALKINSSHFNSLFNLSIIEYNEISEIIKEKNSLSYKAIDDIKRLEIEVNQRLRGIQGDWEHLHQIQPSDQSVVETLSYIYANLKMMDKYDEMQEKLVKDK